MAATQGTPLSRRRTAADLVPIVLTLLGHGGPLHAMVAALGLDERTVAAWLARAGRPGQPVPRHIVQQGQVDLPHVQADELGVKRVGRRVGMAMALAVPSRRWLGGLISPQRDSPLSPARVPLIRSCRRRRALLVGVEGRAGDVRACLRGFRPPVRTGRRGRPRRRLEPGVLVGHLVKRYVQRRVGRVERRAVRGTATAMAAGLAAPGGGPGSKTASSERLTATCRTSLAPLVRRGWAIAHTEAALTAGMWLVGCADNGCGLPDRRRGAAPAGVYGKWQAWTPAMAAGLTNHRWTRRELWSSHVPLPPWVGRQRRGRPPHRARQPGMAVAA